MADQDYPELYAQLEESAQRTRTATIALEKVIGGPVDLLVPVRGFGDQPTLAKRVKDRIDPLVTSIESAAIAVARYAGSLPAAPSTRANGSPLQVGDEYQNTSNKLRYSWDGSTWVVLNASVQQLTQTLASQNGAKQIGAIMPDGTTETAQAAFDLIAGLAYALQTLSDNTEYYGVKRLGLIADGVGDDRAKLNSVLSSRAVELGEAYYGISGPLIMSKPGRFQGQGPRSILVARSDFTPGPMLTLAPQMPADPKGWLIGNFGLQDPSGRASTGILLDISTVGRYISKLTVRGVISHSPYTYKVFLTLANSIVQSDGTEKVSNIDGLFTSLFEDNWSLGGYYFDNVGDSVIVRNCTTTGAGYGYFINQLVSASHILIEKGNCTSSGGALRVVRGFNIHFHHMQCECPEAFTGLDNAVISARSADGTPIVNLKLTDNNVNTQNNATYCIALHGTRGAFIDGGTLISHPTIGRHIFIDSDCVDTVIGGNIKYLSTITDDSNAYIDDNGIGTKGIWKTAAKSTWTAKADPVNGFDLGYFKTQDDLVLWRGNLAPQAGQTPAQVASTFGQTIAIAALGFRPKKVFTRSCAAPGAPNGQALVQWLPTGEVQILAAGATQVYLDGVTYSTR